MDNEELINWKIKKKMLEGEIYDLYVGIFILAILFQYIIIFDRIVLNSRKIMDVIKEIPINRIQVNKDSYKSEKMMMIFNKTKKMVEVYLQSSAKTWKFVIHKKKLKKKSMEFNYQTRSIVIPFSEMEAYLKLPTHE